MIRTHFSMIKGEATNTKAMAVLDILIDELELKARQLRVELGRGGATLVERVDEVGPSRQRQRVRARHRAERDLRVYL